MHYDSLQPLPVCYPKLCLSHFLQSVEVVFPPINSPTVAFVFVKDYVMKGFVRCLSLRFIQGDEGSGEFFIYEENERAFSLLSKEMRVAIVRAIESFRNDGVVIVRVLKEER